MITVYDKADFLSPICRNDTLKLNVNSKLEGGIINSQYILPGNNSNGFQE